MKLLRNVALKVLLALCLVSLVSIGGCCSLTAPDGTQTKNFANCFKTAQDKVCNAPQSVIDIADVVINLLKPEIGILVPGTAPFIALVTAQGIKDTGCAAITGLNTLIAFVQTINTTKAMQARKAINVAPLQTWMSSGKSISVQPLQDWESGKK